MRVALGVALGVALLAVAYGADDFDEFEYDGEDEFESGQHEDVEDMIEVEDVPETEEANTAHEGIELGDVLMDPVPNEFDDPEEFENIPVYDDDSQEKEETPTLKIINADTIKPGKLPVANVYVVEYFLAACLFGYVFNYVLGRVSNGNLAQRWFEASQSFLETQFSMVGDAGELKAESALAMSKEADHIFTLWCSGRTYMEGMLVTLRMVKRQDIFSQVHQKFITPATDRMVVKITVDKMDPMALVVGRAHAIRDIAENYPDIGYYCGEKIRGGERYGVGSHSILVESADAMQVFDKKCLAVLNGAVGDALVSLHISDQFRGARVPEGEEMEPLSKVLVLVFDMDDVELTATQCIKFSVYLADQLNKFSLSREGLEKHKKKRQKREDEANRIKHLERQEELARKREEERRDQYQQMIDEDDPQKQKKMEIELQRRDQKRSQRKTAKMKHMKIRA